MQFRVISHILLQTAEMKFSTNVRVGVFLQDTVDCRKAFWTGKGDPGLERSETRDLNTPPANNIGGNV